MSESNIGNSQLTFIISTMNDRIALMTELPVKKSIHYVVIHQKFNELKLNDASQLVIKKLKSRGDVKYVVSSEVGLSKSRNMGLNVCETKYAYILDDDIQFYNFNNALKIIEDFKTLKTQLIIYRARTPDGKLFKRYPHDNYIYNKLSCASISSIEIALDISFIKESQLLFDEQFGLGTDLPSGEEFIFLSECLNQGAHIIHQEMSYIIHEKNSSGQDFYSTTQKLNAKKAMFTRVFGKMAFFFLLIFFIKKSNVLIKEKIFITTFFYWFF